MLRLYGYVLLTDPDELTQAMLDLDRGAISEPEFAQWLEDRSVPEEQPLTS